MEPIFFTLTVILYALSSLLYIGSFSFKKDRIAEGASFLLTVGLLTHTVTLIARIASSGHIPVVGNFENTLTGSWFIVLFTIMVTKRWGLRFIGISTVPFCLLMLGYGWMRGTDVEPLTSTYQIVWLYIHVFFAWCAYGSYTVAFGVAVLYLLKEKKVSEGKKNFLQGMPSLDLLDELMFRYTIFGFIAEAIMIAAGSIWASRLWGHYWGWDPVETWSLLSWLVYGNLIHLRLVFHWKGSKIAWYLIFAIIAVIVSFWGVNIVMESVHNFKLS